MSREYRRIWLQKEGLSSIEHKVILGENNTELDLEFKVRGCSPGRVAVGELFWFSQDDKLIHESTDSEDNKDFQVYEDTLRKVVDEIELHLNIAAMEFKKFMEAKHKGAK